MNRHIWKQWQAAFIYAFTLFGAGLGGMPAAEND